MIKELKGNNQYWLDDDVCLASPSGARDIVVYKNGEKKEVLRVRVGGCSALDDFFLYDIKDNNVVIECWPVHGKKYYIVCNFTKKVVDRYYFEEQIMEMVCPITEDWKKGNVYIKKLKP